MAVGVRFSGPGQPGRRHGQGARRRLSRRRARCSRRSTPRSARSSATMMWDGPAETLTLTENAQPALMAVSLAAMRVLEAEAGVDLARDAAFVAGHSLGEYSALAAAGALTVADAARLLRIRGRAMQKAVPVGAGAMAALIGLEFDAGRSGRGRGRAGRGLRRPPTTMAAARWCCPATRRRSSARSRSPRRKGAKRAMLLPVSAPFHCALMQPAAEAMARGAGQGRRSSRRRVPLVANVLARPITDPAEIVRAPGRAGDRHGALARVASPSWRRRRDDVLRGRRRQGADRPRQAHRRRRDRHRRSARPTTSPRSRPRAADRAQRRTADVRSHRQDRAGHRRDRRHRRRASPARCMRRARPSRSPARGARRSTRWPASSASRVHVLPCNLADKAAVEALVPRAEAGDGPARHPGRQCRHHPRQSVRADCATRTGTQVIAVNLTADLPPGARRRARHDAPPLRPHHRHHLGGRRHRQSRPGQLRRRQGRHDRHDQVDRARNTPSAASPPTASRPASSRRR